MDFHTSKNSRRDGRRPSGGAGSTDTQRSGAAPEDFRIPAGAKKAALVHLALEAWKKYLLDPKQLGEVRGRDVDEAGLQRALYRSSIGEIEHAIGPVVKGRRVVVEGRLAGTARSSLERLGAEVEVLRLEDEKRYIDMTPAIFILAAVFMAVRYISLGLDDQSLYILAGLGFALMYGLRPFFSKMQRPRDE